MALGNWSSSGQECSFFECRRQRPRRTCRESRACSPAASWFEIANSAPGSHLWLMRSGWTVMLLALALSVGGCSQSPQTQDHRPSTSSWQSTIGPGRLPTTSHRVDCNVIDTQRPQRDFVVVLDTVAFAFDARRPLRMAAQPGADGVQHYFAKAGLGFRLHQGWQLSVPPGAAQHLRIGWGSPGVPGTTMLPPRCHGQLRSKTGWVWYPGGFWTDKAGCYPIVVRADGKPTQLRIGIGTRCH